MVSNWIDPNLWIICCLGMGGAALGLFGLLTSSSRSALCLVPAHFLTGLILMTLAAAQPASIWLPPLVLLGAFLLCQAWPSASFLNTPRWMTLRTPSIPLHWMAMMIACPVLACCWSHQDVEVPELAADPCLTELAPAAQNSIEVTPCPVTTDKGRSICVSLATRIVTPTGVQLATETALLESHNLLGRVIRLDSTWYDCNCHGWVFTGGRYHVRCHEVDAILEDNGYFMASSPEPGDLVIYRSLEGNIMHSGIVRSAGQSDIVLVESKWGGLSRFLHSVHDQVYAAESFTYYRSSREGHLLRDQDDKNVAYSRNTRIAAPTRKTAIEEWH